MNNYSYKITESDALKNLNITENLAKLQQRTLRVLVFSQIINGIGNGVTVSVGALLIYQISNSVALSGLASTMSVLGSALAAYPLARLANKYGRRKALSFGAVIAFLGAVLAVFAANMSLVLLLIISIVLLGVALAVQAQARFVAADIVDSKRSGKSLSTVVWATTIGAVLGPQLVYPGDIIGQRINLVPLSGAFLITAFVQLVLVIVYFLMLKPDPLVIAKYLKQVNAKAPEPVPAQSQVPAQEETNKIIKKSNTELANKIKPQRIIKLLIFMMSAAHAIMVAVMAMTPVHLENHNMGVQIIGITISFHILGMYAFSPIWGWLSDKFRPEFPLFMGSVVFIISLFFNSVMVDQILVHQISLAFIGLAWSMVTVSASIMITKQRIKDIVKKQGTSDSIMNFSGALAGLVSGTLLNIFGYSGLSVVMVPLALAIMIATAYLYREN